uniref:Uncharacterized protein n=1 Tax=Arundo donax TaxID=35708 RepID=A0A0A9HJR2_ARUDO
MAPPACVPHRLEQQAPL